MAEMHKSSLTTCLPSQLIDGEKTEMTSADHVPTLTPPDTAPAVQHHDSMLDIEGKHDGRVQRPLAASNEAEIDPFLVSWDGPDDPRHPLNWSLTAKWTITLLNSFFGFITLTSSTMVAPALPAIAKDLSIHSDAQVQLALSVFVLGYAFGPLWWAPLSELYGRSVVVQVANSWFCLWNLVAGFASSKSLMIAARFLSGLGGSAALTVGYGINADVWARHQRGLSLSVAALFPLLGPAVGPIAGGYITQDLSWRWIFYILCILEGAVQLLAVLFMRETHAPTLLHRKAKALRKSSKNSAYYTELERSSHQTLSRKLYTALERPVRILATHPIVQLVALYAAYNFGVMYIVLSTFAQLWTDTYHQSPSSAGLNYISIGIGFVLGSQLCGPLSDLIYRRLLVRHGANRNPTPEMRTPLMVPGALLCLIGLLWYGWSAHAHLHWIMPNIGIAIFGMGQQIGTQCTQAYLIETYGQYAASGSAAVNVMKSLTGFAFPLFGPSLYSALGWGWGNSVMAIVSVSIGLPMPIVLWKFGARLRGRAKGFRAAG